MNKNLIIMTLECGGADGVAFYLGPKYIGYAQHAYDMEDIMPKILDKMDKDLPLEFITVNLDEIDISDELIQIDEDLFCEDNPDYWTKQEIDAMCNNNLELLEKLIKERCPLNGEDN